MGLMVDAIAKASDWLGGWFRTGASTEPDDFFETEDVDWVGVLEVPISPVRMECPTERESQLNKGLTSVAIYQLDFDSDRWFYRFDHSIAPSVNS
jgi:hypothetical protein